MKSWLSINKTQLITCLIGGILGYSYWYFIGCTSGSCAITSVWWRSTIYGVIIGWLIGSIFNDNIKKKKNEHI